MTDSDRERASLSCYSLAGCQFTTSHDDALVPRGARATSPLLRGNVNAHRTSHQTRTMPKAFNAVAVDRCTTCFESNDVEMHVVN